MTMQDIARLSGTSRSTVHAVLAGKSWVSEETARKVREVIARYGYQPNRLARALGKRSTHLIALILKDIMNPFNTHVVDGISSVLARHHYSALLLSTEDDHEREVQAVSAALSYQVDGIVITPQQVGCDLSHIWSLVSRGVPLVTFGALPGLVTARVEFAEKEAARMAVEHLLAHGHTRIAHLRGPASSAAAAERVAGFQEAILRAALPFDESMIRPAGATTKEGEAAALPLLRDARPTAVLCYNDLVAAGLYRAAAALGIAIPRDLSVVSIDDIDLASVFGPPLTTVRQPCFEMGEAMAEMLLAQIEATAEGQPRQARARVFPAALIERGSVSEAPVAR